MLYSYQYFVAERMIVVIFVIVKVFGLWPYKYKLSESGYQIETSLLSIIYSIFAPALILFAFVCTTSYLYTENSESQQHHEMFASLPLKLIVQFYSYVVIISYLILYVGQHLQYERKKNVYRKCKRIADCMREYGREYIWDHIDLKPFFCKFLCKTLVYDLSHIALLFYNLSWSSETVKSHPYISIFVCLPFFIIRLNMNVFYGGVLFFNVLHKQLNQSLDKIRLQQKTRNENTLAAETQFEKASILYFELIKAMKAFNAVFSLQILLWITTQLILLTTHFFYQYVAVVQLVAKKGNYFEVQNFTILVTIILSTYELFTTGFACNALVTEV